VKEGYTSKAHESKFFEKGKQYLAGFLREHFDPETIPLVTEYPFTINLSRTGKGDRPLKIGGKIDRVDSLPDGSIEIIDYKTGATMPTQNDVDKNLQLSFYALAATRIPFEPYGKKPDKVKLSLYFLDQQEKFSTMRTQRQLDEAVDKIFNVREAIEKSEFKCSNHMFCQNNCEFSLFCRSDKDEY
jgi:RecB family exonuclease